MTGHLGSDDVFLTTEEVLEYLQVNLRTVYRLIKAGKIPAVRVGRQWRFRKRDLDVWLDGDNKPVTTAFEETRVWRKQAGGWRHVHFHRSAPTKQP